MTTKMSRKAFTLVEVLISVTLLAIAGMALMQVSANSKKGFMFLKDKLSFDEKCSIPLTHKNRSYHKKTKDLYSFLQRDYFITNDEVIKDLKNYKISYEQKTFSVINPLSRDEDETEIKEEDENRKKGLVINIDKITLFNKKGSFTAFTIWLQ